MLLLTILFILASGQQSLRNSAYCSSSQVYVKFVKKCTKWASEESWQILRGSTVLYTSPSLSNDGTRTIETCISAYENRQYTLLMKDSYNDSWTDGAWLEVYGVNGNLALKVMMTEKSSEYVNLSLYSPINKNAVWKFRSSYRSGWTSSTFSDSSWASVTLGSTSSDSVGVQYYRKSFAGLSNMAAIELGMYYKYGIVAYINGYEVYRDNMPSGTIYSSTQSSSSYSSMYYHGVYRSSSIAENSQNLLAVELHFPYSDYYYPLQLNAYLAYGAGISANNKCYVAPMDFTVTSSDMSNPGNSVSWTRNTYAFSSVPISLTLSSERDFAVKVDAIRIWPYTHPTYHPSSFRVEGWNSATERFTQLYSTTGAIYAQSMWRVFKGSSTSPHSQFKVTLLASQEQNVYLNEIQFLVCNGVSICSFYYPLSQYTICTSQSFEAIPIVDLHDVSYSIVSGSLPSGLSLNTNSGIISGTPNTVSSKSVRVKAQSDSNSLTITLSFSVLATLSGNFYTSNWSQRVAINQSIDPIYPSSCSECTYSAVSTLPTGITLNSATGRISGTPQQVMSEQQFTIQRSNGCSTNTDYITLTVYGNPSISYSSDILLALGESVTIQPTIANAFVVSIVSGSLPPGLSLNSQTGVITGSPTSLVSSSTVRFRASNGDSSADTTVVFRVIQRITQFDYASSSIILAYQSAVSRSPRITGSCSDYSITSGSLPSGLQFNPNTGVISGTPSQIVTNRQITVRAENDLGYKTTTFSITIMRALSAFSYSQSSYLSPKGVSFTISPSVTGDAESFSITSGSLPTGLQLSSNTGVISGTPSQSMTNRQVTVKVQNALGSRTTTITFTVLQSITSFSYPLQQYILPRDESASFIPSFTGDSVFFSITTGSLPTGLTLHTTTGVLSGTPSVSVLSFQTITITATNALGSKSCSIEMMVLKKPAALSYSKSEYVIAVGESISFIPTVRGDSIQYSLQGSLPDGLEFSQETGAISGNTTIHTDRIPITVVASNPVGSVSCSLVMRVLTKVSDFTYPKMKYSLVNGNSYSLVPSLVGDDVSFSMKGVLPEGLTLDNSTGVIEGVPIDFYANSVVMINAKNDVSSVLVTLQITVLPLSLPLLICIPIVVVLLIIVVCYLCYSSYTKKQLLVHRIEELKSQLPEPVKAEPSVVVVSSSQPTNLQPVTVVPQPLQPVPVVPQPLQPVTVASQPLQPVPVTSQSITVVPQPLPSTNVAPSMYSRPLQPVTVASQPILQPLQPVTTNATPQPMPLQPVAAVSATPQEVRPTLARASQSTVQDSYSVSNRSFVKSSFA